VFEPPPVVFGGPNGSVHSAAEGRSSWSGLRAGSRASRREEKERKKEMKKRKKSGKKGRMEQFEMDLESQSSDLGKGEKDKVPGVLRALVGLVTVTFKCVLWCVTLGFKALMAILSGLARCCGLGKL
jgi:hypothetical protein